MKRLLLVLVCVLFLSAAVAAKCGDGFCDPNEDCESCSDDCLCTRGEYNELVPCCNSIACRDCEKGYCKDRKCSTLEGFESIFKKVECFDNGSISMDINFQELGSATLTPGEDLKVYMKEKRDAASFKEVSGTWVNPLSEWGFWYTKINGTSTFTSDTGLFRLAGKYYVRIKYKIGELYKEGDVSSIFEDKEVYCQSGYGCSGGTCIQTTEFTFKESIIIMAVEVVSSRSIELTVRVVPPLKVSLRAGETKELDIDFDGVNDLRVTLNSIRFDSNLADLTIKVLTETCVPRWICTGWSECVNGEQTRRCVDTNYCILPAGKPETTQDCTGFILCPEAWVCDPWSPCIDGRQTRTCSDTNYCGTTVDKPVESRMCICIPKWSCSIIPKTCPADELQTEVCEDIACGHEVARKVMSCTCVSRWNCSINPPDCPLDEMQTKVCKDVACGKEETREVIRCDYIGLSVKDCNGCLLDKVCMPFGTKIEDKYCDVSKNFYPQKKAGELCGNYFECVTNTCSEGVCISLEMAIEEGVDISITKRFWCRIIHPFDDEARTSCLA